MNSRRAAAVLLGLALSLLPAAGCGGSPGADITYRLSAPDDKAVTNETLMQTVTELDLRLAEAGFERRSVAPLGRDRILVVLPENLAHRRTEIRKILENPEGLKVELEVTANPAD